MLAIVDQLTRLAVFAPCTNCTAAEAARVFIEKWLAFFPDPTFLLSDGGTHFTAGLFEEISEIRGYEHRITTPHSPWTHGGVERLNRVVLKNLRALLQARGLDERDWVPMIPVTQACVNKVLKVSSRGGKTPMELLTGLKPKSGVDFVAWLGVDAKVGSVTEQEMMENLDGMHDALEGLWETPVEAQQRRREQNARARSKDKGVKALPKICVGDFVLVAMAK